MSIVLDSTRQISFDPDSLPHTYTYNGDGTLATDSVTFGAAVFVKTYTYTSGKVTGESAWVKQ